MTGETLAELVQRSLADRTLREFEQRVDEQAAHLREAIQAGEFDNDVFTVGLELEAYVVDENDRLAQVPETVFETPGCNYELGRHNIEINTTPNAFDTQGLAAQITQTQDRVTRTRELLQESGLDVVLDAMWTIPPPSGTPSYLGETDTENGVSIAANMRRSPRYCAIDNEILSQVDGTVELDLPGVHQSFPSILVESLTSSIQPHLQIPDSELFPAYYATGIRTLGPILALSTNSPFLPVDLYTDSTPSGEQPSDAAPGGDSDESPYDLVERTYHEHRVYVFEQAINTASGDGKVRFPRDITRTSDVVDRLVDDRTCAPFLKEWIRSPDTIDEYADTIWELNHKRGTYWRWLRTVIGGEALAGATERSLRIEYRPLPTQPSVTDIIGLQCLVSGLIHGLVTADHPIQTLEWKAARQCFYDVVETGLDADLAWVDANADRIFDPHRIFEEIFEYARRGLHDQGLPPDDIDKYLAPIEARWTDRITPSRWKKHVVTEYLDRGKTLQAAITAMQHDYNDKSRTGTPFVEW